MTSTMVLDLLKEFQERNRLASTIGRQLTWPRAEKMAEVDTMKEAEKNKSIQELFDGKHILVTGATGFLGKVLVEKLLRSCSGIAKIYILVRPKKKGLDLAAEDRLLVLKGNPVFHRLKNEQPNALDKLIAVSGSIELDKLGLSEEDFRKVTSEVSFIFHCAANVRFDDEPRNSLTANLLGVKNVLDFCRLCTHLLAFVHTSTAYAYTNLPEISEAIYPVLIKPQHMLEVLKWMTDDQLRSLCKYYDEGRQTIYHFSKALAENLILDYRDVPAIIVRPSIVTASVNEPYPGWVDNYYGPTGFIIMSGKSAIKTLLVDPSVNADWVPVDTVANTLIVAAHFVAVNGQLELTLKLDTPSGIPVINCTCPPDNSVTWRKIVDICLPNLIKYPSMDIYGKPGGTVTASRIRYVLCRLMAHHIPAYCIDGLLYLIRKEPKMLKLYSKIHRVMGHLEHYTTHSFTFHSPNMRQLVDRMNAVDAEVFPIDQSVLNWEDYIENYVIGARRYVLHEDDDSLPDARMRMLRMHYLCMAVKATTVVGMFLVLYAFKKHLPRPVTLPKMSFPFLPVIALFQKKFLQQ